MQHDRPRSWIQKDYLSFNGIRGLAILLVFYSHFGPVTSPRHLHPGLSWAGVDLFFVLSGFLITGILYQSRNGTSYFRNFYIRRSLRILPVYWGVLVILATYGAIRHLGYGRALIPDFLFLQNLMQRKIALTDWRVNSIYFPLDRTGGLALELGVLWSLCVEEQFYLLWPTVLHAIKDRVALLRIALIGIALVLLIRIVLFRLDYGAIRVTNYIYFEPYGRFDSLLVGAALNLWLQRTKLTRSALRRISTVAFVSSAGPLLLALCTLGRKHPWDGFNPVIQTFGFTLVGIASGAVLLRSLDDSSTLSRIFRSAPLHKLGTISYGFYVYHALFRHEVERVASHLHQPFRLLVMPVSFGAAYALAYASYRFYESPFLQLKDRFAPSHRSVPSGNRRELAV